MARRRAPRGRLTRSSATGSAIVLVIALLLVTAGCRARPAADDIAARWVLDPAPPRTDAAARVILVLQYAGGEPVRGAMLQMAAHMAHPGMAPLVAAAAETVPGSYAAMFQLTMSGDWTIVASGTLADGRRITRDVNVRNVR